MTDPYPSTPVSADPPIDAWASRLIDTIAAHGGCLVAFSGGVDSAVVAAAARRALGDRAVAVTAVSPSVSADQLAAARRVAAEIGIEHHEVRTREMDRTEYRANDTQRCFWCKQTLYDALHRFAQERVQPERGQPERGQVTILSGTNADDLGDHRPGIDAGRRAGVGTPLADLGFHKRAVRDLARHWHLSVWDAPASPCLSSRIAYGVAVSESRLRMIEQAESWLREQGGFAELRVRLHDGELARIEVPADQIPRLTSSPLWRQTVDRLRQIGFRFVTLDLEGFRSGNLNPLVSIRRPPIASSRSPVTPAGAETQ